MTRLGKSREPPLVCETCIEAVQNSGFGDLDTRAPFAARFSGDRAEPHECEYPECQCSCLGDFEREEWQERALAKIPRWNR
jgi:hypothetical protein